MLNGNRNVGHKKKNETDRKAVLGNRDISQSLLALLKARGTGLGTAETFPRGLRPKIPKTSSQWFYRMWSVPGVHWSRRAPIFWLPSKEIAYWREEQKADRITEQNPVPMATANPKTVPVTTPIPTGLPRANDHRGSADTEGTP